jgi:hypothetical protein
MPQAAVALQQLGFLTLGKCEGHCGLRLSPRGGGTSESEGSKSPPGPASAADRAYEPPLLQCCLPVWGSDT